MLTNLIENRGKEFSNLLKIGDYLARSLRENVELFYVENGKVTYITESGNIINASYSFKPVLKLSNVQVDSSELLENEKSFNQLTNNKVSNLLSNLIESDYSTAESSFDDILNLFETKLSYARIKDKLHEKSQRFGSQNRITSTKEFQKVSEMKDKIVEFLKENKKIATIPEIKNGLKLASVVAKAFNLPKLTLEQLKKNKSFSIKTQDHNTIYEHLCRQELIAKELLEAKESFDTTWANNELVSDLASMVYESKANLLEEKVAEIVTKIPYFALATKKQINTLLQNSISLGEIDVSNKDLTSYVHKIYEMKKPVKDYIINLLNEKYGINVNNLTDIPTFSNLLKTESVIFTSISKLSPKNSVIKQVLFDFAKSLDEKNGAESIDVVDFLNEIFMKAGYKSVLNETSLMSYFDFSQVADDLSKIGLVLKMLRPAMGNASTPTPTPPLVDPLPPAANPMAGGANPMVNPAEEAAEEAQAEKNPMQGGGDQMTDPAAPEGGVIPGQVPGAVPGMPGAGMEEPNDPMNIAQGSDIVSIVAQIEDLLSALKGEAGDPSMDQQIPGQSEGEFDFKPDPSQGGGMEGEEQGSEGDVSPDGEADDKGKPEFKGKDEKKGSEDPKKTKPKPDQGKKPPFKK